MMSIAHESKHPMAILVPPRPLAFSDTDIAAAEQLMQLSSKCNSADGWGFVSSSSPLSVSTRAPPAAAMEDSHASVGPQRLVHRYRLLADIYADANPVGRRENKIVQIGNKRKAKS